jgi:SH3-like domain-containing protein
MRFCFIFFLITQGFFFNTNALTLDDAIKNIENTGSKKNDTKDVKKFVCTKSFHSNFRKGPDVNFPIEYEILKSGYPLKVLKYADTWYAVEDFEGRIAWVGSVNVRGRCGAIVKNGGFASVYFMPEVKSKILFSLEKGFILNEIECFTEEWCQIRIKNTKGWIQKKDVWGV